jgi:hypothetical protein
MQTTKYSHLVNKWLNAYMQSLSAQRYTIFHIKHNTEDREYQNTYYFVFVVWPEIPWPSMIHLYFIPA